MHATALEPTPTLGRNILAVAVLLSTLLHLALGAGISSIPERAPQGPQWMEMEVISVEPLVEELVDEIVEPEPDTDPEPEVPDEPEIVDYEEPIEVEQPPVEPKPVPQVVQGLQANSFAKGAGTGLSVRAGTTTAVRATDETMAIDDATQSAIVPFVAVTKAPKVRYKPALDVPQSIIDAQIEGRVELVLTVGADGKVLELELVEGLHPDADAACISAMRRSRWKPGTRGDEAVTVRGVPYSCRYEMTVD